MVEANSIHFTVVNSLPVHAPWPQCHLHGTVFFSYGQEGGSISLFLSFIQMNITWNTSIVFRFEQILFEFVLVLETAQTVHGLKNLSNYRLETLNSIQVSDFQIIKKIYKLIFYADAGQNVRTDRVILLCLISLESRIIATKLHLLIKSRSLGVE